MSSKLFLTVLAAASACSLAGCGGGASQLASATSATTVRTATLSAARIARNIAGVTSLSAAAGRAVVHRPRSTQPTLASGAGQDAITGLYYTFTTSVDGSGNCALFVDAAHSHPAGTITWATPIWASGIQDAYPATLKLTYDITAGSYIGNKGTVDVTIKDSTATNEQIHALLRDTQGDSVTADINVNGGQISGSETGTTNDGTHMNGTMGENGSDKTNTINFSNGHQATAVLHTDGTETVTVTDPSGGLEATEVNQFDGQGQINYVDGSADSNVDVNQSGN